MWIARGWTEYELMDCGRGERLERWGQQILVRPDPQAIWDTPRQHPGWARPSGRYVRSSQGGGQWHNQSMPPRWTLSYGSLTFHVKPMNFKHTGLFPEQAVNWDFLQKQIAQANRPIRVLNLFAYTGGATLACAQAGASVCHVDAAKGMVAWARENAKASHLEEKPIRWIVDDCTKFVEREKRRGSFYDVIILDPPSYGRGPSGEVWRLEEQLYPFMKQVVQLLSSQPLLVLLNSYTTGLAPAVLAYILETLLRPYGGSTHVQELGLPVSQSGLVLPCGASGRWVAHS